MCYYIMKSIRNFCFLLFLPFFVMLFSCSARINGTVAEGGAAEITLKTSLEPRTSAFIGSLRTFLGQTADGPILDGAAIGRSMATAPGIRSVSLQNTGPEALDGLISVSNVGDFLAAGGTESRFITYTEGQTAGSSSVIIALSRESAPHIISLLSPEAEGYLSALMAPAVLGEDMTGQEYLSLLSMVYGRALADEVAAARILASIEFPRSVTAVQGGSAAGRRVEFDVPLLDILVLEKSLRYEVKW